MSDTIPVEESDPEQSRFSREAGAQQKRYWIPPELETWQKILLYTFRFLGSVGLLLLSAACIYLLFCPVSKLIDICEQCLLGIPIGLILTWVYGCLWLRYDLATFEKQVQDRAMIESMIQNAWVVVGRTERKQQIAASDNQDGRMTIASEIVSEIRRLEAISPAGWTYFQTLHLDQLLVDALDSEEELKVHAESRLSALKDYVEESSYAFDKEQYENWEERLKVVTDPVHFNMYWLQRQQYTEQDHSDTAWLKLGRETLKAFLEYVAGIESDWASGSLILKNLRIAAVFTILALLPIAFLPVMCLSKSCGQIGWFEWGLLGAVGALLSVIRQAQNSDVIELGNTEGRKEFIRAFVGGLLGLVAGLLSFAFIKSGLIAGRLFPYGPDTSASANIYLPVIWAVGAGFWFEKVFERVKQTTG